MVKNHLKRLNAPKTFKIKRKGIIFVTRPNPGSHSLRDSLPLNVIIRDVLKYAKTTREVKRILSENNVFVDGVRRKDHRFSVGFMDTLKFAEIKESFRILLNQKGKISLVKIDDNEVNQKLCKIMGKTLVSGKVQLNLFDGRNIIVENGSYNTGDTILLEVPKQEIKGSLNLIEGSLVYLTDGSHIGEFGIVEGITNDKIKCRTKEGGFFETLKKYAFVVGKDHPVVKLE